MDGPHRWHGGRIWTGTGWAESLLVEDGRVVAVGDDASVRRQRGTGTVDHPLRGRLVVPGLIDAHLHLGEIALREDAIALAGRSPDEAEARLREAASVSPSRSGPLLAHGWTEGEGGPRWTADRLDRLVPDRPLAVLHASGHAAVVNSAMLEAAGIRPGAPDPPGGRIGRTADGAPDGRLHESAVAPVGRVLHASLPRRVPSLRRVLRRLSRLGIVAVGTMHCSGPEAEALAAGARGPAAGVRIRAFLGLEEFARRPDGELRAAPSPDAPYRIAGVKGVADGAFGTRTAWLSAPYSDDPSTAGGPVDPVPRLREAAERARRLGLLPAVHALGDRGVAAALDALAPTPGSPAPAAGRIEHAGLVPPGLADRLATSGLGVAVQPVFLWSDHWLAARLGPERARWAYPFGTLRAKGVPLAGSSDAPFDREDPWLGLAALVARSDRAGRSANPAPAEALPPEAAWEAYTRSGARWLGDPEAGAIGPGAPADFVIVEATGLAEAIGRGAVAVRETWRAGRRASIGPAGALPWGA
ncbi:MAG: amidohydrolase [Thermoplasmata archaeon]